MHDFRGVVGGAIVQNDQRVVRERLAQDRLETISKDSAPVISRDTDAYLWRGRHVPYGFHHRRMGSWGINFSYNQDQIEEVSFTTLSKDVFSSPTAR